MRRIAPSLLQCSSHSKLSLPLLSPHLLHTLPQDSAPPPPATLYDWRTRATSRRKPGGIIEPPREIKSVKYKRRKEAETEEWFEGRRYHTAIENYKAKFLYLLAAEQEAQLELVHTRIAKWPVEKLQQEGYMLTGLSAFWLEVHQFPKPVAVFLLSPGEALPYHRFERGSQILLSRGDPINGPQTQGSIVDTSETEIHISFDNIPEALREYTWRVDLFSTDIAYERMRAAINSLGTDPELQEKANIQDGDELVLQGTYLWDVLLESFSDDPDPQSKSEENQPGIFFPNQQIQSWAKRYSVLGDPIEVEGDPKLLGLNATQRRAIAVMLKERVSLIQGPPGTGKTKTIIEAVNLLKSHFEIPEPLLVCTYTNVAVDNLVEGLANRGLRPLRVGYTAKIRGDVRPWSLEKRIEEHALKPRYDKLQAEIDQLRKAMIDITEKIPKIESIYQITKLKAVHSNMDADLSRKLGRKWILYMIMTRDIVENSDAICTTCIASAAQSLNVTDFPVVFVDEASMSTEPSSLIPLMKGCKHVSFIGDHKQLAPVITSKKAKHGGLNISLFERLIQEKAAPTVMLNMQYRMHPVLSRFPSSEFYNLALTDGTVTDLGAVHARFLPPTSTHLEINPATGNRPSVIFLDHAGNEALKDRSRINNNEARLVCAVIEDLLLHNPGMMGSDIGIIAPYAAQVSLLTRTLQTNKKYLKQAEDLLGPLRAMQLANIEVKTVDGFEGREKDVIIFSTVRNNAAGHIGFLADRRRMNVGLTRAKRALFVIGNAGTLKTVRVGATVNGGPKEHAERDVWVRYLDWLALNGAVKMLRGSTLEKMLFPWKNRV